MSPSLALVSTLIFDVNLLVVFIRDKDVVFIVDKDVLSSSQTRTVRRLTSKMESEAIVERETLSRERESNEEPVIHHKITLRN